MRTTSLLLLALPLCTLPLLGFDCGAPPGEGEGEGDDAAEGEGDVAGEGEGEGEGDVDVGEGEGEGDPPPPPPPPSCGADLPTPSDACIAESCGNDLGVGQPCTEGGDECDGLDAGLCTADHGEMDLRFCTKFCLGDSDCGDDATCSVDPDNPLLGRGCVRNACL